MKSEFMTLMFVSRPMRRIATVLMFSPLLVSPGGCGDESDHSSDGSGSSPLPLAATATSPTSIHVSWPTWGYGGNAFVYATVHRNGSWVATVFGDPSYEDTFLRPSTKYDYKVYVTSKDFLFGGTNTEHWGPYSGSATTQAGLEDQCLAFSQGISTLPNTPIGITLTGSGPNGHAITYSIATWPTDGTLSGYPPYVAYTPKANFIGDDKFTFTVSDGWLTSSPAWIAISVSPFVSP